MDFPFFNSEVTVHERAGWWHDDLTAAALESRRSVGSRIDGYKTMKTSRKALLFYRGGQ
jgi:hypothetical protein